MFFNDKPIYNAQCFSAAFGLSGEGGAFARKRNLVALDGGVDSGPCCLVLVQSAPVPTGPSCGAGDDWLGSVAPAGGCPRRALRCQAPHPKACCCAPSWAAAGRSCSSLEAASPRALAPCVGGASDGAGSRDSCDRGGATRRRGGDDPRQFSGHGSFRWGRGQSSSRPGGRRGSGRGGASGREQSAAKLSSAGPSAWLGGAGLLAGQGQCPRRSGGRLGRGVFRTRGVGPGGPVGGERLALPPGAGRGTGDFRGGAGADRIPPAGRITECQREILWLSPGKKVAFLHPA